MENESVTAETISIFLGTLSQTCNVTRACEAANINRMAMYRLRKTNAEFAAAWDEAREVGVEVLEDAAVKRATEGVQEPIYHQGVCVDTVRKYSDTLLIFLLKGAKPETYRENQKLEISGQLDLGKKSDDELREELTLLTGASIAAPEKHDDASDLVE